MKNKTVIIITILTLFLLLGISLGSSITMFIIFLMKNDNMMAIVSYLLLGIFTILIIVLMGVIYRYRQIVFNNQIEEIENEEESR